MEKTVKSCGECPFLQIDKSSFDNDKECGHPDDAISGFYISRRALSIINEFCPEGGEFVITTKKLDNETTTI